MYFHEILPRRSTNPNISPIFQQWSYFSIYIVHQEDLENFFKEIFNLENKILSFFFPNLMKILG